MQVLCKEHFSSVSSYSNLGSISFMFHLYFLTKDTSVCVKTHWKETAWIYSSNVAIGNQLTKNFIIWCYCEWICFLCGSGVESIPNLVCRTLGDNLLRSAYEPQFPDSSDHCRWCGPTVRTSTQIYFELSPTRNSVVCLSNCVQRQLCLRPLALPPEMRRKCKCTRLMLSFVPG